MGTSSDRQSPGPSDRARFGRKVQTSDCSKCLLLKSLVDAGLPMPTIRAICDRMWLNLVKRRQILFVEGNRATHLYAVRKGKVKLIKVDAGGREHVTAILESGDLFGLEAVFDETYSTGAEALTDCELCLAPRGELEVLLSEVPTLAIDLARYLHHRLVHARRRHLYLGTSGARAKLAGYLLDGLGDADPEDATVPHDLTLKEIGGVLGLSPETVCRTLGTFKAKEIIEIHSDRIRIQDVAALRRMAGV